MSRYNFRLRSRAEERDPDAGAFYGEVGWDEDLATFYARVWREAPEEAPAPADYEPLASCGGHPCEVTELAELERCLADHCGADFDVAGVAANWGERLEADRDRYMESLGVEQEMNLLFRLRLVADP